MKLKVLGTQSPYATNNHNCPGFLIISGDCKIMLDCGSGTHRLLQYPNDLQNLNIIITHLHEDHYSDIGEIQYTSYCFGNQKRLENPITIFIPKTPEDKYKKVVSEKDSYARYYPINENKQIKIRDLNINFLKTDHAIETYAVKVSNGSKTIVYSSDTSFSGKDKLIEFAKDADLLICESSLLKEHGFPEINSHLAAYQAASIAKKANVKGLMLTHFWPEEPVEKYVSEAKTIFSKVIAAKEGTIIDFEDIEKKAEDIEINFEGE